MLRVLLYAAFHLVHTHARVYNSRQQEQYDCAEPNSERCIQKGAEILCIYADIVLENLTAANGSAFFRLASAMSGSTSESIPQVRLPTEHITEIEIVVDIFCLLLPLRTV